MQKSPKCSPKAVKAAFPSSMRVALAKVALVAIFLAFIEGFLNASEEFVQRKLKGLHGPRSPSTSISNL